MAKVLYLVIVEGETLTNNEVSDVFFGATKLFQSQEVFFSLPMTLIRSSRTCAAWPICSSKKSPKRPLRKKLSSS